MEALENVLLQKGGGRRRRRDRAENLQPIHGCIGVEDPLKIHLILSETLSMHKIHLCNATALYFKANFIRDVAHTITLWSLN